MVGINLVKAIWSSFKPPYAYLYLYGTFLPQRNDCTYYLMYSTCHYPCSYKSFGNVISLMHWDKQIMQKQKKLFKTRTLMCIRRRDAMHPTIYWISKCATIGRYLQILYSNISMSQRISMDASLRFYVRAFRV